ncbi:MAG: IgGFc-binding protein [Deltaproteobacteria bacterium]|nr:IgGFc-binding protein [Deltaproteobacteria bacterium]
MHLLLLGALAGCGGNGAGPARIALDPCEESQEDQLACGRESEGGYHSVLECTNVNGYFQWLVEEVCIYDCEDAACVDEGPVIPGQDTPFIPGRDTTPDPGDAFPGRDEGPSDGDPVEETALFCEPGTPSCIDETTQGICNDAGTEYDPHPCDTELVCDNGFCLPVMCSPWELEGLCLGPNSYSRCNQAGTQWEAGYCEQGFTCYQGMCVDYQCPPGQIICKGMTAVQECQMAQDGSYSWVIIDQCEDGICQEGACVSACEVNLKENSYLGCDYWAVDLDNIEGGQYEPVALVVSVPQGAGDAEITVTDMSLSPPTALTPQALSVEDGTMIVTPGQLKIFMLPTGHDIDGSIHTNRSFRVESTAPVTMHQFNPLNGLNVFTNDASLLLPSTAVGQDYLVMSWPMRTSGYTIRGFVTIIGTQEDVTHVQVWPSSPVLGGSNVQSMQANPPQPYEFYLEQGDVLNLETDGMEGSDLTGTRISADQKVNVFGGHECANIPLGVNYCDHVEQQLYPVTAWGSHYVGDAFYPRNGSQVDTWRIMSGADNVQVIIAPPVATAPATMSRGQWFEFTTGQSFNVTATGPILVGHYLQGSNYPGFGVGCPDKGTGIGDPAFTLVVPVEQFLDEYTFLTPPHYVEDYVNITFKPGTQVMLDGAPVMGNMANLGEWAVIQMKVGDGVHTVTAPEPFGLTVYGYDCDVSYAYPGGLKLKTIQ